MKPWHLVLAALLGVWMMVAPSLLGFETTPAEVSARIAGPLITTFAVVAIWQVARGLRSIVLLAGLWLVVAPLILTHDSAAAWNSIATGAATAALAAIRGRLTARYDGGWRMLFQARTSET